MTVSISRALSDQHLLGAGLGDVESWRTWMAVLKAAFGEKLSADELKTFALVAGERAPPAKRVRELWAGPIGRRSGKSRIAAAVAVHLALLAEHKKLAPGEVGIVACIAASKEQAKTTFGYIRGFLQSSPLLADQIDNITNVEIRLKGDISITMVANSFRTSRGQTLIACVGDEVSYWRSEESAVPDLEVYRAVLPSLVQSGGMWVGISTGYRRAGLLYTKHRDFYAKDDPNVLVVSGPTTAFNPTIDPAIIAAAREEDPEAATAEWDGSFRTDLQAFLNDNDIDRAIDYDRPMELGRRPGVRYKAFCDPSGGRHDAFTLAIGHHQGTRSEGQFVLDCVRGFKPPFDPQVVVKAFAELLREDYKLTEVTGDSYSGEWVVSAFKDAGIKYLRSDKPKSALYLEAAPLFSRGAISLPNDPYMIRELRLLERRTHRSGKDSVDHGQQRGAHDDYANSVLGCAALCAKRGFDSSYAWAGDEGHDRLPLAQQQMLAFIGQFR